MKKFPYRQIHLDFHTSEKIPGIASAFNPADFAATLKEAAVDSITCFARCHHGWLYHDSKVFPELVHPGLEQPNLLERQIEACHREGIRVPVYTTVQWDGRISSRHPEFCVITPEGTIDGYKPHEPGFYAFLCVNTPYRDFLKAHLDEVLTTMDVDGIFMDIVMLRDCSCRCCQEGMRKEHLDVHKKSDRMAYARRMLAEFKADMAAFIRSRNRNCSIFFNGSHIGPGIKKALPSYTHLEVESLPSGGWGYAHFPLISRYTRGLGMDFCGMTGKFHTHWGDFHSFKNQAALEYECFNMLALGGGCSIGDQLLPSGRLEKAAYDLIGKVYSSVKEKEPWCRQARPLADIGLFNLEEWEDKELPDPMMGALRALEEMGAQFDLIDSASNFEDYKLLILPDRIPVDKPLAKKLKAYLKGGGKILATFESGLTPDKSTFSMEEFGISKVPGSISDLSGEASEGKYYFLNDYCDFIRLEAPLKGDLPGTELNMYIRGLTIKAEKDTNILAQRLLPCFHRTAKAFCSHQHAPSSGQIDGPAATLAGRILYFSHPLFTIYRKKGPRWIREILKEGISLLIQPRLTHKGPTTLKTMVNIQEEYKRWVLHFLHYIPEKRCEQIEIIEDVIPLYHVELSLLCEQEPKGIRTVPEGDEIAFSRKDNRVEFTLPSLRGHQMVEVQF